MNALKHVCFFKARLAGTLILLSTMCLVACERSTAPEDNSKILARVNGSDITEAELNATIEALLGKRQASELNDQARKKMLEGRVASRAIMQQAEQELDKELLLMIDKKAELHRENLLLNEYVRLHMKPEPLAEAKLKEYYFEHPEEFGGGSEREYELITSISKPSNEERPELVKRMGELAKQKDWQASNASMVREGLKVEYRKGKLNPAVLDKRLVALLQSTKVGSSSSVSFIQGKPTIVRVLNETQLEPKPFAEVAADIRQKLTPGTLEKSVQDIQRSVMEKTTVEYY